MNIFSPSPRFPPDLALLIGTVALVGVWWWTFSQSHKKPPANETPPQEPTKDPPRRTKREEFFSQKPVALDDFVKRRHEKILAARPIKKKKPEKLVEYSSDEDKSLYRLDPDVLQRHSNKSLYEAYSYTSEAAHAIAQEDKDQPYAKNGYVGYSSFRPEPEGDQHYFPDQQNSKFKLKDDHRLSNWNRRFRHCLRAIRELDPTSPVLPRIEANLNLMHLAQDFIYAATSYGKIIISEYYLPLEEKIIKPCKLGGLLGGQKYIVQNILFKFAVDYNGLFGSDYSASKVAGNELRGLISYYNCHLEKIHVPLMALVDYRGFRLIAMSILPVGNDTIVYGSCDAGRTVHAADPTLNALMALAAEKQNLKAHECRIAKQNYRTMSEYQQRKKEIFATNYDEPRVIHKVPGIAKPVNPLYNLPSDNLSSDEEGLSAQDIKSEDDAHEIQFPEFDETVDLNPHTGRASGNSGSHERAITDMAERRRNLSGSFDRKTSPLRHSASQQIERDRSPPDPKWDEKFPRTTPPNSQKKVSISTDLPKRTESIPFKNDDSSTSKSSFRKSMPARPRPGSPGQFMSSGQSTSQPTSQPTSPHASSPLSHSHNGVPIKRAIPFGNSYENNQSFMSYEMTGDEIHDNNETTESESNDTDGYDSRGFEFVTAPKKQRECLSNPQGNLANSYDEHEIDNQDCWDIRTEMMHSPADLEGHKGRDGRFYLLDFSRTQPPEKPNPNFKNAHLSLLLRPEFLQEYHKPLCPDAFSGFIRGTAEEQNLNRDIEEATKYLHTILLPKFAKELCEKSLLEAEKSEELHSFPLTEAAHRYGINCRHFGRLRNLIPNPIYKTFILGEIVARCIKNNLRWKLREKMKQIALPLEEPYRRLIITYLNLVFGNSKESDLYLP